MPLDVEPGNACMLVTTAENPIDEPRFADEDSGYVADCEELCIALMSAALRVRGDATMSLLLFHLSSGVCHRRTTLMIRDTVTTCWSPKRVSRALVLQQTGLQHVNRIRFPYVGHPP